MRKRERERRMILELRYQQFVVEWLTFLSGIREWEGERDELGEEIFLVDWPTFHKCC